MRHSLVFVATTPFAVNAFLRTHLLTLARTYDVTLCVNTRLYPLVEDVQNSVRVWQVDIERPISLWRDLLALYQLFRCFRSLRPDIVHSMTPKGGLLAMLAGLLARVPLRFHTFTGQVWATKRGAGRRLLKGLDCLIALCATRVFADSASQCRFLTDERVVRPGGVSVLGSGSVSGVDLERFRPDPATRDGLRAEFGVSDEVPVFLFVGRLVRDKGVADIFEAFSALALAHPDWELWMVGPDEEGWQADYEKQSEQAGCRIRWCGATMQPERFMAAADVFVMPSYREGFGSVVIEAAACGIPTIAYRIDGIVDAVEDDRTGLLVNKYDRGALARAMQRLATDAGRRLELGEAALERARGQFSSQSVTQAWVGFYESVLGDNRTEQGGRGRMKRLFDLCVAILLAVALSLPILLIAALVWLTSPGPALYWSDRVGRHNKIFRMPKFRSMRIDTPAVATHLLQNPDQWLTPIGSFLRKTSLDELPQLWSILKGDMSFVGPRPALFNQDDLIALRTDADVHELMPGLTGWAQVNGRDELPISEKVKLDVEYIRRRSIGFDLWILWLTLLKVLRRDGVSH